MQKLATFIAILIAAALAAPVAAQTGTAVVGKGPGMAGAAQTVKVTATITAIDAKTRDITLKGPQGNEVTVTAGPDVKNFAKMKVGDQVNIEYLEALTLELKKGGGMIVQRTVKEGMAGAKPGAQPAGGAGRQVTIVADVVDVDAAKQTITLRGPKRTVELKIPGAGTSDRVRTMSGAPGTLALFRGHWSPHRVTPVEGNQMRVNAVLSYARTPGQRLKEETYRLFYGRIPT